jgi:hypothetical protein
MKKDTGFIQSVEMANGFQDSMHTPELYFSFVEK